MLLCTEWKARPLSPEQMNRMMAIWGKIEAQMAEDPNLERQCWYINNDGTGGFTVVKAADVDAGNAFGLEVSLALGEFLDFSSHVVLDLDSAMPVIGRALERISG